MTTLTRIEPIDYLLIGHITKDLVPGGYTTGGTVSYAARTALALGLRVGLVTSCETGWLPEELGGVQIAAFPAEFTTTFENITTPEGRIQYLHHRAECLNLSMIPESWRTAPIVHFAPVAQEIDYTLVSAFPQALVGMTPQGWMREWDEKGLVRFNEWPEYQLVMSHASAVVLSIEDLRGSEDLIEEYLSAVRILVVTEGKQGARLYWNGDVRYFKPPEVEEVDPVGAGDIFATVFFWRLYQTRDPWEAARLATLIAANSVSRRGLLGAPTESEVKSFLLEILPGR